jgi:ubiquinone/menaquinone biosynthesis C-methylase UbiE
VVEALGIRPGDQVADLGSGGGYFTFRLADAVGSNGRVHAVDVDADMNEALERDVGERGVSNVDVILGDVDDPLLPENGIDLIFSCNTYHHLEDRTAYFAGAAKSLKEGGRVAIIEYRRKGIMQRWLGHGTSEETMREEMEAAGYRLEQRHDFLDRQHFLVFAR